MECASQGKKWIRASRERSIAESRSSVGRDDGIGRDALERSLSPGAGLVGKEEEMASMWQGFGGARYEV